MLQTSTLQFLKQLAKNNNKEWFDANRKKYDAAKADYIESVQKIINAFSKTDAIRRLSLRTQRPGGFGRGHQRGMSSPLAAPLRTTRPG